MTKKHFEAVAHAMKLQRPNPETGCANRLSQWRDDCTALAYAFREFNPRFDSARFLAACGMDA